MIRINKSLKSYSKINLFLSVGKKIKGSHLHNIQSLVFLINIYDKIKIQKNNQLKKDEVKFYGKFSSFIKKKNNSISKSFELLRRKGYIKEDNFYKVSVYKRIPVFSGLGGGSSNSAVIAKFFLKKPINLKKNINYFSKHLGSDFKLFFKGEQIFQSNLNYIAIPILDQKKRIVDVLFNKNTAIDTKKKQDAKHIVKRLGIQVVE